MISPLSPTRGGRLEQSPGGNDPAGKMKKYMKTQTEILARINGPLRHATWSFKSAVYVNWEINSPGFQAGVEALAAQRDRHEMARTVVSAWAEQDPRRQGKKAKQARKNLIRKLVRNCDTIQQMEAMAAKYPQRWSGKKD